MAKVKIITTVTNSSFKSTENTKLNTDDKGHHFIGEYMKGTKKMTGDVFIPFHAVSSLENVESVSDTDKE